MDNELRASVENFIEAFEQVFDKDWNYTKSQLRIFENQDTDDADTTYVIAPNGTFLHPKVDDEIEDWGWRGGLLEHYRKLKLLLSNDDFVGGK